MLELLVYKIVVLDFMEIRKNNIIFNLIKLSIKIKLIIL